MKDAGDMITIVIPTYRRPELLAQALASAIDQTAPPEDYRILVVDNDPAPDTETERLVRGMNAPNLTYVKNEKNVGGYGNWNRGFRLADTEWVCLLHDDDLLLPGCIEEAYAFLACYESPRLGAVLARQCNLYDDPEEERRMDTWKQRTDSWLRDRARRRMWKVSLFDNYMLFSPYPAVSDGNLLRRSAVLELGGFGTTWPCEDIFFLNRLALVYDCWLLGRQWGWYRYGTNNRWSEPGELVKNDRGKKLFREGAAKFDRRCAAYHRLFGRAMELSDRAESVHFAARRGKKVDTALYTWLDGVSVSLVLRLLCRVNRTAWRMWMFLRAMIFGRRAQI